MIMCAPERQLLSLSQRILRVLRYLSASWAFFALSQRICHAVPRCLSASWDFCAFPAHLPVPRYVSASWDCCAVPAQVGRLTLSQRILGRPALSQRIASPALPQRILGLIFCAVPAHLPRSPALSQRILGLLRCPSAFAMQSCAVSAHLGTVALSQRTCRSQAISAHLGTFACAVPMLDVPRYLSASWDVLRCLSAFLISVLRRDVPELACRSLKGTLWGLGSYFYWDGFLRSRNQKDIKYDDFIKLTLSIGPIYLMNLC